MKLCIITCYNQPDYVRAQSLRAAARLLDNVEVIETKNANKGILRYIEVFWKVLQVRVKDNPDVYLLTFRGYEMLLPIRLISWGRPLIYDEFINPIEWVALEKRQVEANQLSNKLYAALIAVVSRIIVFIVSSRLFKQLYRLLVSSVELILADTDSHAAASAKITGIERSKIEAVFVGTDESTFRGRTSERIENEQFTVFYYGNMLPLHGLRYVIDAAVKMKHDDVKFVLVGGNAKVAHDVAHAVGNGAKIEYHAWVEFERLPKLMQQADACLAGPFGGTFQAQYVITGKTYQYLAMGSPTIIGANEETHNFTHKKNVLITPQADVDGLVETIHWAMKHQDKLPVIGEAGRKLYDEKFSVPVLARQLEKILLRLNGAKLSPGAEK